MFSLPGGVSPDAEAIHRGRSGIAAQEVLPELRMVSTGDTRQTQRDVLAWLELRQLLAVLGADLDGDNIALAVVAVGKLGPALGNDKATPADPGAKVTIDEGLAAGKHTGHDGIGTLLSLIHI